MGTEAEPTERPRGRPLKRLALAFVSPNSYGMVLALIVVTYVAATSLQGVRSSPTVVVLQAVTVWFALRVSRARRVTRLTADVILAIALLLALASALGGDEEPWRGLPIVSAVLYFVAPISILRHLVARRDVDQETVLGALAAYLLIGMFFGFVYRGIGVWQDGPLFGPQGDGSMPQILFFSFTTLTTTGYGNLVPAANPGQTFAVAEMLIGQLFLITAVSKVINAWRPARWSAVAGPKEALEAEDEDPT